MCKFICDDCRAESKSNSESKTEAVAASNISFQAELKSTSKLAAVSVSLIDDIAQANIEVDNEHKVGATVRPQDHRGSNKHLGLYSPAALATSKTSHLLSSPARSLKGQPEKQLPVSLKSTHYGSPKLFLGKREHLPIVPSQPIDNKISTSSPIVFNEHEVINNSQFTAKNPSICSLLALPPYSFGNRNSNDLCRARAQLPRSIVPRDINERGTTPRLCIEYDRMPDLHSERSIPQILLRPHSDFQQSRDPFLCHESMVPTARPRIEESCNIGASDVHVSANNCSGRLFSLQASIQRHRHVLALRDSIRSCEEELALVSCLRRLNEARMALKTVDLADNYFEQVRST